MATKKQQYRGARGHSYDYSRQRGYAEQAPAKKRGGAVIAGIIFFLLAVAAIVLLNLEFFTAYKPSNGFKKANTTEQTETAKIEELDGAGYGIEHTAGIARSYASTYATTTTPPCSHLSRTIDFPLPNTSRVQPIELVEGKTGYRLNVVDRVSGEVQTISTAYFAGYYGLSGNLCLNTEIWCIHNIRNYMASKGHFFVNFSIDWSLSSLASWDGVDPKPMVQEIYDSKKDTLLLRVDHSHTNGNNLVFPSSSISVYANKAKYLVSNPVKEGHTFTGWYTDEACTNLYEGYAVTDDITLYAGWQINTYTLALDGNGGELSQSSVSSEYNTVPTIPTPTRTGYTFMGWKTSAGQAYDVSSSLTQNLTLVAQWQINTHTLTLNGNDGELSQNSVSGAYNTVPEIPTPTRTGYTFMGWKTSTGQEYDISTPLTQDLTLVAQWQINTYTLTLNGNGGECASSVSGEYNTVPEIPTPTRTGYTFMGWKTADGQAYDTSTPFTQDLTITAQWEIKTYTVTFVVDGVVYQTMTVDYGTKLVYVTESVEPALYALYSIDEAGESLASDYAIESDITVYAEEGTTAQKIKGNWKKITVISVCGAVLFVSTCYGIAVLVAKRKKNRQAG